MGKILYTKTWDEKTFGYRHVFRRRDHGDLKQSVSFIITGELHDIFVQRGVDETSDVFHYPNHKAFENLSWYWVQKHLAHIEYRVNGCGKMVVEMYFTKKLPTKAVVAEHKAIMDEAREVLEAIGNAKHPKGTYITAYAALSRMEGFIKAVKDSYDLKYIQEQMDKCDFARMVNTYLPQHMNDSDKFNDIFRQGLHTGHIKDAVKIKSMSSIFGKKTIITIGDIYNTDTVTFEILPEDCEMFVNSIRHGHYREELLRNSCKHFSFLDTLTVRKIKFTDCSTGTLCTIWYHPNMSGDLIITNMGNDCDSIFVTSNYAKDLCKKHVDSIELQKTREEIESYINELSNSDTIPQVSDLDAGFVKEHRIGITIEMYACDNYGTITEIFGSAIPKKKRIRHGADTVFRYDGTVVQYEFIHNLEFKEDVREVFYVEFTISADHARNTIENCINHDLLVLPNNDVIDPRKWGGIRDHITTLSYVFVGESKDAQVTVYLNVEKVQPEKNKSKESYEVSPGVFVFPNKVMKSPYTKEEELKTRKARKAKVELEELKKLAKYDPSYYERSSDNPCILWQHRPDQKPIGCITDIRYDENGAVIEYTLEDNQPSKNSLEMVGELICDMIDQMANADEMHRVIDYSKDLINSKSSYEKNNIKELEEKYGRKQ